MADAPDAPVQAHTPPDDERVRSRKVIYRKRAPTTSLLADLGAEVVKVERPGGDNARAIAPDMVEALNRGKRSICIDLKTEAGRAVLCQLAERSDVRVEGFRPGVTRRLGVDYDSLSRLNPRLIYASVSGYGASGPQALRPGHDLNYLSGAGVEGQSQRGGEPTLELHVDGHRARDRADRAGDHPVEELHLVVLGIDFLIAGVAHPDAEALIDPFNAADIMGGQPERLTWAEARHAARAGWERFERKFPDDADRDGR